MLKMQLPLSDDGRVKYEYDPWKKSPCCTVPCYMPGCGPAVECTGAAVKTAVMGCAVIPCLAPLAPVLPMVAGKLYNCMVYPLYKCVVEPTKPEPPQKPGMFKEGGGRTLCAWHLPQHCCNTNCECSHCYDCCGFFKTCCNCMGCEGKCEPCYKCMDTFDCCKYCDFGARCRTCFGPCDSCIDLCCLTLQCPLAVMSCDIELLMKIPCAQCMVPCMEGCKAKCCGCIEGCVAKCGCDKCCGNCCKCCNCCGGPDVGPPKCCGIFNPCACCEGVDGQCCYCWKPMGNIFGPESLCPHVTYTMCCPCCPSIEMPCCWHDELIETPPVATYIIYRKNEAAEAEYRKKIDEYKGKYAKMKEEGIAAVVKDEAKAALKSATSGAGIVEAVAGEVTDAVAGEVSETVVESLGVEDVAEAVASTAVADY